MSSPIIALCNRLDVTINALDDFLKELLLVNYKKKIKMKDLFPDSIDNTVCIAKDHIPIIDFNKDWILEAKKLGRVLFKSRDTIIIEEKLIRDIIEAIDGMSLLMRIIENKNYLSEEYKEYDPRKSEEFLNRDKSIQLNRSEWIQKVLENNKDNVEKEKIINKRNLDYKKTQNYKDALERRRKFSISHGYPLSELDTSAIPAATVAQISIPDDKFKEFTCQKCGGKILEKQILTKVTKTDTKDTYVKVKYMCKACNHVLDIRNEKLK